MLMLQTLGRLDLRRDATAAASPVPVQSKRLVLLAYLCVAAPRHATRRDVLLGLFWPEASQDEARRNLRQALYHLRASLGEGVVVSRGDDDVGIAPGRLACDATAFAAALAAGRAGEALGLYSGDFLAGVFVADGAAELEQWVAATRQDLRLRAARAAWTVAEEAERTGDMDAAVAAARRGLELAPDDEPGVRALIRLLDRRGDRAGALRAYHEFARRLDTEFGAEPAPETRALGRALEVRAREAPAAVVAAAGAPAPAAPPAAPYADVQPAPASARENRPRPRRAVMRWAAAAVAVGAAALAVNGLAPGRDTGDEDGATLPPIRVDRLLVADFRNRARDSLLGDAVTEAMRVDLAQSRQLRVLTTAQVAAALERMARAPGEPLTDSLAQALALREGIKAFVTGEVASLGPGYTITAQLVASESGEMLAAVRETASDSTGLLAALDRVSDRLRRRAGESLPAIRASPPLEQVTTSSLDALRLYSRGVALADRGGDERGAMALVQSAVVTDSAFAMAWRKLGVLAANLHHGATERRALANAYRFRERLPAIERHLTAATWLTARGRAEEAIEAYGALLELRPQDTRALNNVGYIRLQSKQFAEAEAWYARALMTDSGIPVIWFNLASARFDTGDLDAAERTVEAGLRRHPGAERLAWMRVSLAIQRQSFDSAARLTHALLADTAADYGTRSRGLRTLAMLALARGRVDEAERHLRAFIDLAAPQEPAELVKGAASLAFLYTAFRGRPEAGLREMERALGRVRLAELPPLDARYDWRAYNYALAGRPARARALLEAFRRELVDLPIGSEAEFLRPAGVAYLAEGRTADAEATLRRTAALHFCPVCPLPDLARAYEAGGRADSAIAAWERYVSVPWSERWDADGEFLGTAYRRLGELYDERADTARAVASYRTFIALWSGADAPLQPQVARARFRLEALDGTR